MYPLNPYENPYNRRRPFSQQPPPEPVVEDRELTEEEKVGAWRVLQLLDVGVDVATATILGGNPEVDLHQALRMAQAGCDSHTMLLILT